LALISTTGEGRREAGKEEEREGKGSGGER
jgi:hypothetical protein